MSFSDRDLKGLKEYCNYVGAEVSRLTVLELIDRLEAGEKFISKSFMPLDWEDHPEYKAWLKSAGRV